MLGDNQGLHQCGGIYSAGSGSNYPCRQCECTREDLMYSDIGDCHLRNSTAYEPFLEKAFEIFCRYVRCEKPQRDLSRTDKENLEFCNSMSVHHYIPALYSLKKSYTGQSVYSLLPPDLMHTRLLEEFVSNTLTIVKTMEMLKGDLESKKRMNALAIVEERIQNFPYRQAMPFRVKHLKESLESYCPKGELKLIDSKDVPSLLLQLILCK